MSMMRRSLKQKGERYFHTWEVEWANNALSGGHEPISGGGGLDVDGRNWKRKEGNAVLSWGYMSRLKEESLKVPCRKHIMNPM